MNSDLAREENFSRSESGTLGTCGAPLQQLEGPVVPREVDRSSYSTDASPAAALAAASSRVAESTPPVAPSERSAPSTVAAQPRLALTSRRALRSAPRSAGASESRNDTSSSGSDPRTTPVAPAARADREQPQLPAWGRRSPSARRPTRAGTRDDLAPGADDRDVEGPHRDGDLAGGVGGARRVAVLAAGLEGALLVALPRDPRHAPRTAPPAAGESAARSASKSSDSGMPLR